MLLPRIIYNPSVLHAQIELSQVVDFFEKGGKAVLYNSKAITQDTIQEVNKLKRTCLHYEGVLLLDNLKLVISVRADGVVVNTAIEEPKVFLDQLEQDAMIGLYAEGISQITEANDLGMANLIMLGPVNTEDDYASGISMTEIESILTDARIFSYDIPIYVYGDLDLESAKKLMERGCYGVVISEPKVFQELLPWLKKNPLR